VDGDRGGAGAALDAAGGDDQAGMASDGVGLAGTGDPLQLSREVGGAVGPGEQAAGTGGEGGSDVGWAVVVADGDDRDPAVKWQAGQGGAADQGDRRAGHQRGLEAGWAGIGHHHLPAAGGLDRMPQGVGGSRVVVGDDDQRGQRRNGLEGHGASSRVPGVWVRDLAAALGRSGAGNNGRATGRVEDAPARMCITPAGARLAAPTTSRGCGLPSFADRPDE
jgi:hypothetical protein